ncbi:hypothetical protein N665_0105s0002 [Sinapis alba]|nr:hypothetical protein N665_0105s0002 [Sinapis alba]
MVGSSFDYIILPPSLILGWSPLIPSGPIFLFSLIPTLLMGTPNQAIVPQPFLNYEIDRSIELDLVSGNKTPETAMEGYCRAYVTYFEDCSLSFPILEPLLDILTELGLSFTQMCLNFLSHFLTLSAIAREEGLLFGLEDLRQLCLIKRNKRALGTFLISPRPSRLIVEGILYRDDKWRENFFVFRLTEHRWKILTS